MRRKEEIIAEYELTKMYEDLQQLKQLNSRAADLEDQLARIRNTGPKSPRIKSREEAKYQRGTRPTDDRIIDRISAADELEDKLAKVNDQRAALQEETAVLRERYNAAGFTDQEKEIIKARYSRWDSVAHIAARACYAETYVYRLFRNIHRKYFAAVYPKDQEE